LYTKIALMTDEDWDSLLEPDYDGLPACCIQIREFRILITWIKNNGINYPIAQKFIQMADQVMDMHCLTYSTSLIKLVDAIREWKTAFDAEVDDFNYGWF
jgi:hypothetical protein